MSRELIIAEVMTLEYEAAMDCMESIIPVIQRAFKRTLGRPAPVLPTIIIRIGETDLEGKVGSYKLPNAKHKEGILTVNPGAFTGDKAPYQFVIAHELLHAFLGVESENHGDDFDTLAQELNIPDKYRD